MKAISKCHVNYVLYVIIIMYITNHAMEKLNTVAYVDFHQI